ncbi:PTS transporter subunit EIIC [Paenibacillus amylolyticus]|uniref:Aryl-b-glucoside utilization protein, BglP n=1 Tax=Paenibacillus amylolyticus TaxID=1451 RepID=A0A100VNT9_PAEAM|nr:PTS transporter subunit EIIC [Paenibacillus amylolyticus]GAS83292.1 aryl-b-glucoside utilization protein, BglP [Paenibacillus amylolyticus]
MHDTQIKDWLKLAGGKENIKLVDHNKGTTTLLLKDSTQLNMSVLVSTEFVADIRVTGEQCHLVIRDESSLIYNTLLGMDAWDSTGKALQEAAHTKKNRFSILHFVSDVFRPLMPAFLGAAVIKILLAIFTLMDTYGSADSSALMDSQTFTIFRIIGDSVIYLLPVLVAISTAYRLKSNIYVAASIGGLMFHPEMTMMMSGEQDVHFLGLPLVSQPAFYTTAIWVILTICAASYLEKAVQRISPKFSKGMVAPFLTLLILVPLVLMILGPVGTWVDEYLPEALDSLLANAPVVTVMLLGAVFSLMLVMGLHYWVLAIIINEMVMDGGSMVIAAMMVAIVGQAGASLAIGLRSKEPASRRLAFWATGTALLGVVEPALYAVNMRKRSSFYAALLGGAAGGLYFGLLSVKAFAIVGNPSLISLPLFIEESSLNLLHTCIGVVIAFVVSGGLTYWMAGKGQTLGQTSPKASME